MGAAEISASEDNAGARDPDADLARARDRQQEDIRTRPSGRAEIIGGNDRCSIAGERGRVGCEVAEHRSGECADAAPEGKKHQKGNAILREARGQHHDHCGADHGADHPEPALTQRSPELQLAHNRRGGTRPKRIVEFEPERNEESEAHRRPEAKCVQQWRSSLRRIREGRVPSANGTCISSRSGLVECV